MTEITIQLTPWQAERSQYYRPNTPLPPRADNDIPEILSPAGNYEKLKAAVLYGADAVYLAAHQFGLRAFAGNFAKEELAEAIDYAHRHGVRVYVTINILAHPSDIDQLPPIVEYVDHCGADGVIVSDPGIFRIVKQYAPDIDVNISTQASVTNQEACNFWYEAGARRIILARELSLKEIAVIRQNIPPDMTLEGFVHGAMCMAWSGRCLLSNIATGRDANRGACAQPCRWSYHVTETGRLKDAEDGTGEPFTWQVEQDETGSFMFSSRDICMIDHIPALINAGINSFKIEGRMKGAYYVGIVTKTYRQAVDTWVREGDAMQVRPEWREELMSMVHRDYDTGFYFNHPLEDAKIAKNRARNIQATVVAIALEMVDKDRLRCEQRNKLMVGEEVEFVTPHGENFSMEVTDLFDEDGEHVMSCPHPQQIFEMTLPEGKVVEAGSFIRRRGKKHGEM
ncbi:MAG: U32 family peptidase [Clostridiaceae bacterium]|nr:U32 family peptidase [Clostridiaceae bacterium]